MTLKQVPKTVVSSVLDDAVKDFPQDLLSVLELASKVGVELTPTDALKLLTWLRRWHGIPEKASP